MIMTIKKPVVAYVLVDGECKAREFPTIEAARAFMLRRHDHNGVTDIWVEDEKGHVVAAVSDIVEDTGASGMPYKLRLGRRRVA
jgi:hypothetical protein